jgi:hypothetical protein
MSPPYGLEPTTQFNERCAPAMATARHVVADGDRLGRLSYNGFAMSDTSDP